MIIRGKTYLFILFTLCLMFMVYFFENKVQGVVQRIEDTNDKLAQYSEDLNVLEAEWSYLNSPERLTRLAEKIHDDMESPVKLQFTDLKSLPIREVFVSARQQQIMP